MTNVDAENPFSKQTSDRVSKDSTHLFTLFDIIKKPS